MQTIIRIFPDSMSALFKLNILTLLLSISIAQSQSIFQNLLKNKIFYVHQLRNFIRSEEFKTLKNEIGDVLAVDLIYKKSLVICDYDIKDALLVCGLATLDHRKINFKFPLLGLKIPIFLTSESREQFLQRTANLPSHIFSDTIEDRDKLQHFFFSAYLTYTNEGRASADKIGLLVEEGEKLGLNLVKDERDILANRLGQNFGLYLHKNPFTLPSRFLRSNSLKQNFNLPLKSK